MVLSLTISYPENDIDHYYTFNYYGRQLKIALTNLDSKDLLSQLKVIFPVKQARSYYYIFLIMLLLCYVYSR